MKNVLQAHYMLSFVLGNLGHFPAPHDEQNIKILNEDRISIVSGSSVAWHGSIYVC